MRGNGKPGFLVRRRSYGANFRRRKDVAWCNRCRVDDAFAMVDLQSKHGTTGQFKGQVDSAKNPHKLFQAQNLRGGD